MEIDIIYPDPKKYRWNQKPLKRHYPRQLHAQPAYVELDCKSRTLLADYDGEVGGYCVPSDVYHGHALRFRVWNGLTTKRVRKLLDKLQPIAEQVVAGYQSCWDGNNMVGKYTAEARKAMNKIDFICQETFAEFYA